MARGQTALCCCSMDLPFLFPLLITPFVKSLGDLEPPKGLGLLFTKFEGAVPLASMMPMGHGGESYPLLGDRDRCERGYHCSS